MENKTDSHGADHQRRYIQKNPWMSSYTAAKYRCSNKEYRRYGARGIRFLLTKDEMRDLWFRDEADKMICPSIDRIDSDGNYELENCRFIEHSENSRLGAIARAKCSTYHPGVEARYEALGDGGRRCVPCEKKSKAASRAKARAGEIMTKKECPVCLKDYTESSIRKRKRGWHRAFRHFDNHLGPRWCNGEVGKHYAMVVTTPKAAP